MKPAAIGGITKDPFSYGAVRRQATIIDFQ